MFEGYPQSVWRLSEGACSVPSKKKDAEGVITAWAWVKTKVRKAAVTKFTLKQVR